MRIAVLPQAALTSKEETFIKQEVKLGKNLRRLLCLQKSRQENYWGSAFCRSHTCSFWRCHTISNVSTHRLLDNNVFCGQMGNSGPRQPFFLLLPLLAQWLGWTAGKKPKADSQNDQNHSQRISILDQYSALTSVYFP